MNNRYRLIKTVLFLCLILGCENEKITNIKIDYVRNYISSITRTTKEDFIDNFKPFAEQLVITDETDLNSFSILLKDVKFKDNLQSPDVRILISINYQNKSDTILMGSLNMVLNNRSIEFNKPIIDFLKAKIKSEYLD